ncbi:hypothetical protein DL767_005624 [Monosporascus sp. MG133]|nr:hypothetical protein DL767_005624 [Monosporascus sp. MG133]
MPRLPTVPPFFSAMASFDFRVRALSVIAKIDGKYRILGFAEQDWLPIFTCSRLLQIFSSKANYKALKQELDLAAEYFKNNHINEFGFRNNPFPFIVTCLFVGASCAPQFGFCWPAIYADGHWDAEARIVLTSDAVVIDITDLAKPRYCIVENDRYPIIVNRGDHFDVMSCRARSALRSLVREPHYGLDWFEDAENLAKDLDDDSQLIDMATLVNLYPNAGWPANVWKAAVAESADTATLVNLHPDAGWPEDIWMAAVAAAENVRVPIHVNALTEMAVKTFVKAVQEDGGCDESLLRVFLGNENLKRALRSYLSQYEKDMATSGPAGQLLKVAFAEMEHVNLTPWTALPIDAIKTILHSECVSPYVRTVSISSRICPSDAEALAEALPPDGIDELYMFEPRTHKDDPTNIYSAVSPKVRGRILLGSAFACSFRRSPWLIHGDNSPVRPGFPVSQLISQDKARIATTFLGDAMISPIRLVTGIFSVMRMRLETTKYATNHRRDAPLAFASAPDSLGDTPQTEISCLPAEAYLAGSWDQGSSCSRLRNLNPGGWTMLLIRDTPDSQGLDPVPRYKIGFVETKNPIEAEPESADTLLPEDLTVIGLEGFLRAEVPEFDIGSLRVLEESLTELAKKFVDKGRLARIGQEPLISTITQEEAYSLLKTALSQARECDLPRNIRFI